ITGPEGHEEPVANALPAWDLIAGNMVVSALLAAERHRLRTGKGQAVDLTLKDVAAAMVGHLGMIGDAVLNPAPREKSGNSLYGAYGQDFLCACGRRVMVIGLTRRQWEGLLKVTGTCEAMAAVAAASGLDLSDEGNRWKMRDVITAILAPWFAARPVAGFAAEFDRVGITWSVFRTLKEAVKEDPDLSEENPIFSRIDQPGLGRFPVPGLPVDFASHARQRPMPAPALGAHTEEVLADVARLDDGEIARLFDRGVVDGPRRRARPAA
ncbi:CoA transferase, partial [Cribrihabitans sp. XS_ASV171]